MNGPKAIGLSSNAVLLMDTYIHGVDIQDKAPSNQVYSNKYHNISIDYVRLHTHLKTPEEVRI